MSIAKWIMKQYWRMGTIRAWMSLGMGMLALGRVYYEEIPILADLGFLGAVLLGGVLILIFMGIGWLYDEKARMWRAKLQVNIDRNPYRCVPNYKAYALEYPVLYIAISSFHSLFRKLGIDDKSLGELEKYLAKNYTFRPEKDDINAAQSLGEEYMRNHPFNPTGDPESGKVGLRSRAMLGFETQTLRLNWVQELTGMAQDSLVIAGVYVVFLFPDVVTDGMVPVAYLILGIFIVTIPILFMITAVGWFYDRKLYIWSVDTTVRIERNPYSYLAEPSLYTLFMPFYYTMFTILRQLLERDGLDTSKVDKIMEFLQEYFSLDVAQDGDMKRARELRREFGDTFRVTTEEARLN